MEEWKEYKLGEIINVLDYKRVPLSAKERSTRKGIYPYYGAQGIIDYVDDYIFDGTYLLIAEDGENLKSQKQNIAQLASGRYWVNNHAHIVENNNRSDLRYICYLLNSLDISGYITGSAQPKLNQANLVNISVHIPPLETQQKIASILSALDDKIEVNRKISENLEQQAQALFKSWFVDFEPFKNGEFVESELGMIPKGWRVGKLSEIADYVNGLAMQKFRPQNNEQGLPVLKIKELGQGYFDANTEQCSPSLVGEKYIIHDGDIIFSWSGTLMVKIWCGGLCGLNQHLFVVVPNNYPKWFVYLWTLYHLDNFIRIAKDKAVTMGHIKRGELDKAYVTIPNKEEMEKCNALIAPIYKQIISNELESRRLAHLRDTLLPKLMSGELKVNEL
ncbi:MAG: restriction endonuclease subunit S [Prevotella sp.]|nr:restriction endonuclease subunit S [Prevotella sp.]